MTAASIEFRSVSKQYGDVAAVRNLSFTIAAGTLVTLPGRPASMRGRTQ